MYQIRNNIGENGVMITKTEAQELVKQSTGVFLKVMADVEKLITDAATEGKNSVLLYLPSPFLPEIVSYNQNMYTRAVPTKMQAKVIEELHRHYFTTTIITQEVSHIGLGVIDEDTEPKFNHVIEVRW
jgi:hypothetical protein